VYLSKGLELIGASPQGVHLDDQELSLQMAIAVPFLATRGYSAPEVERAYRRAAEICDRLGRSKELFPVLRGLWNCHLVRSDLGRARQLAEQVVALAEDQGEPHRRALGRRALGSTLFYLGRFDAAAEQFSKGIAIDAATEGSDEDRAFLSLYAERAGVVCRTNLGMSLWFLGFPDQALRTVEAGFALARQLAHAHSIAYATVMVAMIRNCRREFAEAVRCADAAIEVSREHGLSQWLAMGMLHGGFALAGLGKRRRGLELIREGLSAWHAIGARIFDTQWLGYMAAVHLQSGPARPGARGPRRGGRGADHDQPDFLPG
jgi:tetratricopeptide (TPR) repeat protein